MDIIDEITGFPEGGTTTSAPGTENMWNGIRERVVGLANRMSEETFSQEYAEMRDAQSGMTIDSMGAELQDEVRRFQDTLNEKVVGKGGYFRVFLETAERRFEIRHFPSRSSEIYQRFYITDETVRGTPIEKIYEMIFEEFNLTRKKITNWKEIIEGK